MSATEALRQAGMTANTYLVDGIIAIDEHFGEGYCKRHPELLSTFMIVASKDFELSCKIGIVDRKS